MRTVWHLNGFSNEKIDMVNSFDPITYQTRISACNSLEMMLAQTHEMWLILANGRSIGLVHPGRFIRAWVAPSDSPIFFLMPKLST
jgi:hypothetical protein